MKEKIDERKLKEKNYEMGEDGEITMHKRKLSNKM